MAFNNMILVAAFAAASTALAPVALAQAPAKAPVVACDEKKTSDVLGKLAAAPDAAALQAILAAAVAENAGDAICIMNGVKANNPAQARSVFQGLIAALSTSEANEPIISTLMEQNEDLVAATANDVEPAAGDETTGTPTDLGTPGADAPGENPSQLNQPEQPTTPVSPVAPRTDTR